jgi:hypothetical protein
VVWVEPKKPKNPALPTLVTCLQLIGMSVLIHGIFGTHTIPKSGTNDATFDDPVDQTLPLALTLWNTYNTIHLFDTAMGVIVSTLAFPAPAKEISVAALLARAAQNQLVYLQTISGHQIPAIYIQNYNCNNNKKKMYPSGNNFQHHHSAKQQEEQQQDCCLTLIYSHGNAEDVGLSLPYLDYLSQNCRCHVLAYEYCGYSVAEGEPSEQNCYQCIQAAYDYLVTQQVVNPSRIALFGRSLGTGKYCIQNGKGEWGKDNVLFFSIGHSH